MNTCKKVEGKETKCGKELCCHFCDKNTACFDACKEILNNCQFLNTKPDANNKDLTEPTINEFTLANEPVLRQIVTFEREIKKAEKERDILKQKLIKAMKDNRMKSFENEYIKLTYIEPTHKELIDSKRLKEERPDIAKEYIKVSEVKETVKITVRE